MLRAGDSETGPPALEAPGRTGVRRWLLLGCGSVAALAAVLVAAGLVISRQGAAQPVRANSAVLPDGSVVRLEAVTYGKQHRWGPEKDAVAWLRGRLRWPPGQRVPDTVEETTTRDAAMFWITRRDAENPRRTLDMAWWTDYEVLDEHGCRFGDGTRWYRVRGPDGRGGSTRTAGPDELFSPSPPPPRGAVHVGSLPLTAFPRRSSAWTLRLYRAAQQPIPKFSVANPAPGVYPTWTPEALPATHRCGDLAVTLMSVSGTEYEIEGSPVPQRDLVAGFNLRHRGRPALEWEAGETDLADATGNQSPVSTVSLCARESAWKLRTRFWRTARARYSPSETWTLSGVRAPRRGQVLALSGMTTLKGVTLELLGIAGPGRFRYTRGVPSAERISAQELREIRRLHPLYGVLLKGSASKSGPGNVITFNTDVESGRSHIGLRVRGLSDNQRLMFRATDEQGRVFLGEDQEWMNDQQVISLDLAEDARTLKLTFVVQSPRTVEFLIAPPAFTRSGGQ